MRKVLRTSAWVVICDIWGIALLAALLIGGTGTPVFAYLVFLAPFLLLACMALGHRRMD